MIVGKKKKKSTFIWKDLELLLWQETQSIALKAWNFYWGLWLNTTDEKVTMNKVDTKLNLHLQYIA